MEVTLKKELSKNELIDGKPLKAVKEEINNLSKFNKIRKFIGLAIDPNENDFDENSLREVL